MQISFDTSLVSPDELTALIALCASLGGRLPANGGTITVDLTADTGKLREVLAEVAADDVPVSPVAASAEGNAPSAQTDTANIAPSASENAPSAESSSQSDASPTTGNVELDTDGIPWDERIHASTKTTTADGKWRKRKNVDEVLYGQVHAELQELHAAPLDDTPPPPASSTPDENAPTDDTDVPPPPVPDASAGFSEFPELVQAVAQYGLPYVKLGQLAGEVTDGLVAKFPDLRDKPDYWSAFFDAVKREVAA